MELTPTIHQKKQTINTLRNELQICEEIFVQQTELFDEERHRLKEEVKDSEQIFNERIAECQSQIRSLRKTINNGNKEIYREKRRHNEEMRGQRRETNQATNELKKIEKKLNNIKKN